MQATSEGESGQLWKRRTQLRALTRHVMAYNNDKLDQLNGADTVYKSFDDMNEFHPLRQAYAEERVHALAPPSVTLNPGAVLLTTSAVDSAPTATHGGVCECRSSNSLCVFRRREVTVAFAAVDLIDNRNGRLASRYAITVVLGRAKGTTLDTVGVDVSDLISPEDGLVYTALSRCRYLYGLFVEGLRREFIPGSCEETAFLES